jgi:hypothetical protein
VNDIPAKASAMPIMITATDINKEVLNLAFIPSPPEY